MMLIRLLNDALSIHEPALKMTVFWNVVQYSLVGLVRRFKGTYCLHHQGHDDGRRKHL
jgi:hypothetical protein